MLRHAVQPGWVPLMDYAVRIGVSLSTLRRHIKANKIAYRVEDGRYLVLDPTGEPVQAKRSTAGELLELRAELQKAHEEIAELKTLIALYEEKIPEQPGPRVDS